MNFLAVVCGVWMLSVGGALEFAPTRVASPHIKTIPPTDGDSVKYIQTVYKATNRRTMVHTVEPLRPSYEVSYQSTEYTTVNNQTISTSSVEFATVLNSTVEYDIDNWMNYTYIGAPTFYQTLEFASQEVTYTPITGSNTTAPVTITETHAIPLL